MLSVNEYKALTSQAPRGADSVPYRTRCPRFARVLPNQTGRAKHKGGYDYHKNAGILTGMYNARGNGNQQRARYTLYNGAVILTRRLIHQLSKSNIDYIPLENSIIVKTENGAQVLRVVETTKRHAEKILLSAE